MGRVFRILSLSVAVGAAWLPIAAPALGAGTTTSAGDQQYVDPLSGTTTAATPSTSTPSTTSAASSNGSSGSSQTSSGSQSTTTSATGTTPSTPATSSSSTPRAAGNALPFTGLNLGALVAVGVGLLGAGLLLRRIVRRI